ncbi:MULTISPECIES: cbb3-type cytochrome c oxidase subunit 3 [unclassified Massilia]|uniref:cbb3-type cytochrome oxidase subunit 3 n=1 Tax=unclassified Massilia TaxID=2609279 RepID=UPI00210511C0|nr:MULTISPECIES: cbb3-type cytochrome c oxidase subunit 3 [unclassified Massilia]UTY57234.1 cbb3-type cytochrome c oxidase subunit 3 [Massilia sp. erpn]
MAIDKLFDSASSIMTVVSFITFIGIVWWAWAGRNQAGFAQAAQLPFADEEKQNG